MTMRMQRRSRGHDSRIIKYYSKELFLLYSFILQILQFDVVNIFYTCVDIDIDINHRSLPILPVRYRDGIAPENLANPLDQFDVLSGSCRCHHPYHNVQVPVTAIPSSLTIHLYRSVVADIRSKPCWRMLSMTVVNHFPSRRYLYRSVTTCRHHTPTVPTENKYDMVLPHPLIYQIDSDLVSLWR